MPLDRRFAAAAGIPVTDTRPPSTPKRRIDAALADCASRELISTSEVIDLLLDLRAEV